ncbi:hypothetical protein [Pseudorhodoplanes sp.]|uniref:hypothetical protein n=1 Tax=Pseudorhodoplanes sp. TaxID=1934341 RepID=UPI002C75469A|nr:hypothetical protein [Pseudorhodoplanes sp.]HWV44084.1 hypothetical protein [Pseudorhodoplanes sp.]
MAKSGELTQGSTVLPVQRERRIADAVAAFLPAYDKLRDGVMERRASDMRDGLAAVRAVDVAGLERLLADPPRATAVEIAEAAGVLIAVTKHLDKTDGEIFQRTLVQFIADEQPTRLGLAIAMRRVLLAAKFTPSIAEVIETLRAAESDLRSARQRLEWLPDHVKAAEALLNG